MPNRPVKVRLAPSPTGDPHIGTAYQALFNYAFAKKNGGTFILRIEDTDQKRSTRESELAILSSLRWLGITWDEGPDIGGKGAPYRQSDRIEIYREYVEKLVKSGVAYWCTCSPDRLDQVRKRQQALRQPTGYDGYCRERNQSEVLAEIEAGQSGVIRLRTPKEGKTTFNDILRGEISIDNSEVDDQVLLKSDGFPTYHLANVVDDHLMGISHVIRGEEWISSTPKHILLYEGFGFKPPQFCHLPLLRNADKSKVSKRKNPVSLEYFREAGYLPETLLNFLGLMAFSFPDSREMFSLADFVENFSFDRISLGGPVFDLKKLLWLNGRYLRERNTNEEFALYLKERLFSDDYLNKIVPLVKDRVEKSEDFVGYSDFFFKGDVLVDPVHYQIKGMDHKATVTLFETLVEQLEALVQFDVANIDGILREHCLQNNIKSRDLFMPVRLMVTGKTATPPLFETMAVLGKERCRTRIRAAIHALKHAKFD